MGPWPETLLPLEVHRRASLRGNEYAWPVEYIPVVIEAARAANLLNVGGQLQFRLPSGTCECYWIQVDTYKLVPIDLCWADRVAQSAAVALREYEVLRSTKDFMAEGQDAFGKHVAAFVAEGGTIEDAMCFVWYLDTETDEMQLPTELP